MERILSVAQRHIANVPGDLVLADVVSIEDAHGHLAVLLAVDPEVHGVRAGHKDLGSLSRLGDGSGVKTSHDQCGNHYTAHFRHLTFLVS